MRRTFTSASASRWRACQLARSVRHGDDDHLDFAVDLVAPGAKGVPGGAGAVGQDMDDALDLSNAVDIYPKAAQRLGRCRRVPRAIGLKADGQVAGHWQRIVGLSSVLATQVTKDLHHDPAVDFVVATDLLYELDTPALPSPRGGGKRAGPSPRGGGRRCVGASGANHDREAVEPAFRPQCLDQAKREQRTGDGLEAEVTRAS